MAMLSILSALVACGAAWAQEGNLLVNGAFDAAAGDVAEGWSFVSDVGEQSGLRKEKGGVEDGPYVEATLTQAGQCDFRPVAGSVATKPGTAYLLTAWVKAGNAAGGSHSIELQWFGENAFLSRDIAAAAVADKWVRMAVGPVQPPKGAVKVIPLLRCYAEGTYGFDSVGLWEVPGRALAGKNVLQSPGFESDGNGDGHPDGWSPNMGDGMLAGGILWDPTVAHTGQYSARLTRPAGSGGTPSQWTQREVAVTPSARYELTAATRADTFGRKFRIAIEWTKAGKVVEVSELKDQTTEGWQSKTLRAVSPPEADHANLILELSTEGTVWFDDVALVEEGIVARLDLWLEEPNARGLIREGVDPKQLRVRVRLETDEKDVTVGVRLVDAQGKVVEETPKRITGDGAWLWGVEELPRGAYRAIAEAVNPEGRVLASEVAPVDIVAPDAPGLHFREDHVALLEGKPWFPIGVCSMPVMEPVAERLAQSGFNLIVTGSITDQPPEKVQETLDRARSLGLYLIEWNNGYVYSKITSEERHSLFVRSVANVAGHPGFLGWACDEALWNGVPLSEVRDGYLAARAASPTLVFWQNQAPRNTIEDLARYTRWCDVTGMDIYPVDEPGHSDLPNKTLSVVGDEMDKQHQTVSARKPVWAILQGFGWNVWEKDEARHKRAPSWEESRFMAYEAILHGATGIIYWGASYEDQEGPIWDHLRRIARELADLMPVLTAEEKKRLGVEPAEALVRAEARRVEGKWWVLAVNESAQPTAATLTGLPGDMTVERVGEEAGTLTTEARRLVDTFAPYGVHVYRQQ